MIKARLLATSFLFAAAAAIPLAAQSQATGPAGAQPTVRVRGVIEKVDAVSLVVKDRSGEVVTLGTGEVEPGQWSSGGGMWRVLRAVALRTPFCRQA